MTKAKQKMMQQLNDAHASEQSLAGVLEAQIAIAPRGSYRKGLQQHLRETRDHALRIDRRLGELDQRENLVQFGLGLLESALEQGLALGRTPLERLRGSGGPERVLKNAREACATEAREIATYMSIERLAETDGDKQTAKLAASIRAEEQKMLEQLLEELPKLTSWVLDADTHGKVAQAVSETARGGATRPAGRKAKKPARQARTVVKRKAPRARKAPVTARAQSRTSPATPASELPISDYQTLTVEAVVGQLPRLSQNELAKLDSFERRHENRPLILNRIATLRSDQQRHGNGGAREENVGRGRDEGASRPGSTFDPSRSREGILTGAKN